MNSRTEFLSDIITTAVEGGIGYWSATDHYQWADDDGVHVCVRGMPDRECAKYGALAIVRVLRDDEGYEDEQRWITPSIIEQGIARLTNGEVSYPDGARTRLIAADCDNWAGNIDADVADDIVQAGLLGELRYA